MKTKLNGYRSLSAYPLRYDFISRRLMRGGISSSKPIAQRELELLWWVTRYLQYGVEVKLLIKELLRFTFLRGQTAREQKLRYYITRTNSQLKQLDLRLETFRGKVRLKESQDVTTGEML